MGRFIGSGPDRLWVSEVPGSTPEPAPEQVDPTRIVPAPAVSDRDVDGFLVLCDACKSDDRPTGRVSWEPTEQDAYESVRRHKWWHRMSDERVAR